MNFFKKTLRSILGLSNSEDQPPSQPPRRRRIIQSPVIGLSSVSDTSNMPGLSNSNVLHSVNLKPVAAGARAGEDDQETVRDDSAVEFPEYSSGFLEGIGANRLELSTECLGFESCLERSDSGDLTAESSFPATSSEGTVSRKTTARARSKKAMPKDFPPLLSSLNENGRPRFNLKKMTIDGRLEITRVQNDRPEIVRVRGQDGGLKLKFTSFAEEEEEEEEEEEDEERDDDDDDERDSVDDGGGEGGRVELTAGEGSRRSGGDLVR